MLVLDLLLFICGVYLIILSAVMHTRNTIRCKVMLFFIGLYCLAYAIINSGIVALNI